MLTTSSEFIALCQEQLALLAQGLEASLSVVYLTQELVESSTTNEAKLIPVVAYPERSVNSQEANSPVLPVSIPIKYPYSPAYGISYFPLSNELYSKNNLYNCKLLKAAEEFPAPPSENLTEDAPPDSPKDYTEDYLLSGDQIVLPLIHEDAMLGLLVTVREDRTWNEQERSKIERIAQTLSLACVLDQRRAWLQRQLHQQQMLQEKQQDLLDDLLHQFRNPLTALRTFGKLLLKRLQPGDANREVATSIVRESDRLQELLQRFDEVIDLTPEDLEPLTLPPKKTYVEAEVQQNQKTPLLLPSAEESDIDCLIGDILEPLLVSAKAIAQDKNVEIIAEVPSHLPLVRVQAKALREALSNIIDNAVKYTPDGGKILIQAGQEKLSFQGIAITDTGPGIPPEDLKHLGERHYRGVQAQTEIPGTGLGLAIAKQLIEQMQGKIQVFSPALHSNIQSPDSPGTTFMIWLPVVSG
jgi:signal transduction histidine kinase